MSEYKQEYMNYMQAMEYLGFKSQTTLNSYIDAGLPVIKVGKSKRISKTDIDEFMNSHKVSKAVK